jgi:hypothetical protein
MGSAGVVRHPAVLSPAPSRAPPGRHSGVIAHAGSRETLTAIAELAGVKVSEVRAVLKSAGAQPITPQDALGATSAATDAPPSAHQVAPDAGGATVGDAARPVGVGGTA